MDEGGTMLPCHGGPLDGHRIGNHGESVPHLGGLYLLDDGAYRWRSPIESRSTAHPLQKQA